MPPPPRPAPARSSASPSSARKQQWFQLKVPPRQLLLLLLCWVSGTAFWCLRAPGLPGWPSALAPAAPSRITFSLVALSFQRLSSEPHTLVQRPVGHLSWGVYWASEVQLVQNGTSPNLPLPKSSPCLLKAALSFPLWIWGPRVILRS